MNVLFSTLIQQSTSANDSGGACLFVVLLIAVILAGLGLRSRLE